MKEISERKNRYKSKRVVTVNNEPSKTQQQFRDEVNINSIMRKYHSTGQITHLAKSQGQYRDLSNAQDYFDSLNIIQQAEQSFATLPSHVRKKFGNDPAALLEFIHNPDNFEEGVKLGIFQAKPPQAPIAPITTNDEIKNDETSIQPTQSKKQKP